MAGLRGVLINAGDFEGAEPAARAAVRLGATAHDWTLLGWTLERLDRAAEAAEAYASAIQEREDHLWARNALALLRAKSGEHDAALALARKTTELFPDAASARLHLGLVACLAGDPEAGRIAYAEALERAGRDVSALVAVATAYVDVEDHELAWKALQRALAVEPGNARALVTAGVLSLAQGKLPEAEEFLSRAVKVSRHDARAWHLLGLSAQRQGDVKDAIRAFRKANKLKPDVLEYRVALALAYAEAGTLDAGITALKRALELAPTRADLYLQLGFLQIKRKKNADALRSMKRMVELAPEDPRPHFYLAIIYGDHLGKKRDAKRELESYVELGGNEPAALRWLEGFGPGSDGAELCAGSMSPPRPGAAATDFVAATVAAAPPLTPAGQASGCGRPHPTSTRGGRGGRVVQRARRRRLPSVDRPRRDDRRGLRSRPWPGPASVERHRACVGEIEDERRISAMATPAQSDQVAGSQHRRPGRRHYAGAPRGSRAHVATYRRHSTSSGD